MDAPANRRARGDAGFTLVEMLVSVALMGLLSLIMLETLRFSADGYARRLTASDAIANESGAAIRLRTLLESAMAATRLSENGELLTEFEGRADSMRFVAPAAALTGGPGLAEVTIALAESQSDDADAPRPLIASAKVYGLGDAQQAPRRVVLAERVTGLDLAYYGFPEDAEPGVLQTDQDEAWVETWSDRTSLPALVRLQARSVDGREWPLLVVAPQARHPPE